MATIHWRLFWTCGENCFNISDRKLWQTGSLVSAYSPYLNQGNMFVPTKIVFRISDFHLYHYNHKNKLCSNILHSLLLTGFTFWCHKIHRWIIVIRNLRYGGSKASDDLKRYQTCKNSKRNINSIVKISKSVFKSDSPNINQGYTKTITFIPPMSDPVNLNTGNSKKRFNSIKY